MLCKEKSALVTGAAGNGTGRSIALTLAREGAAVIVNYRSHEERAAEIVQNIRDRGGQALAVRADIRQPEECRALVEAAEGVFGQVDICIINPGAGWHPEPVDELDAAGALDDVTGELAPLYNLMPLVLPGMYERTWGRFIGISLNLTLASPSFAYDAAKAARTGALRRAAPDAWQHGVTVNIIAPGPVPAVETLGKAAELCDHGPAWQQRENITPQDIAENVAWLCSDAARFVTGCELPFSRKL